MFEGDTKFLDGDDINGDRIIYTSFPRCGNTFLRKYFEVITGVATGSDMTLDLTLTFQMSVMKGERITDDTVWIRKSHYPYPTKDIYPFTGNKIICCVRNPIDVICSMF
jgi:hypothetical protein